MSKGIQYKTNNALGYLLAVIASVSFIIAAVVVSVEININNNDAFMKEYELCGVSDTLGMDMKDIEYVSQEMMKYLYGQKEELVVNTTMWGQERDFFNQRERDHMVDVKNLLDSALMVRSVCLVICLISLVILILYKRRKSIRILSRGYMFSVLGVALSFGAVFLFILANGFTEFWNRFHGVFFTNDLWLLDPNTDMMIRLLPEQFFSDLVINCVCSFVIIVGVLLVLAFIIMHSVKSADKHLQK